MDNGVSDLRLFELFELFSILGPSLSCKTRVVEVFEKRDGKRHHFPQDNPETVDV